MQPDYFFPPEGEKRVGRVLMEQAQAAYLEHFFGQITNFLASTAYLYRAKAYQEQNFNARYQYTTILARGPNR